MGGILRVNFCQGQDDGKSDEESSTRSDIHRFQLKNRALRIMHQACDKRSEGDEC